MSEAFIRDLPYGDKGNMSQEQSQMSHLKDREIATLGGGCFWCTEAVFAELRGVEKVESGYTGGTVANPTYKEVCTGRTGHAEAVQISFDPKLISFKELLRIFFTVHDPTTPDRQGADVGAQYRSIILYHNDEQRKIAEKVIEEINLANIWGRPVITEVVPFRAFYLAEDYHQEYFKRNPEQTYCQVVIAPKIAKFRQHYLQMLKNQ